MAQPSVVLFGRRVVWWKLALAAFLVLGFANDAMRGGLLAAGQSVVVLVLFVLLPLAVVAKLYGPGRGTSHGTARFADAGDVAALKVPAGCLLGRLHGSALRFAEPGHLVTVAPTRSGKGVSAVIPNLLTYAGGVFCLDPKAENFAVSARARRALGQEVHALDPWGLTGSPSASVNPLDWVRSDAADAVDDAAMLADMLVVSDSRQGDENHWDGEAKGLLEGLILYVCGHASASTRTLGMVREVLTLGPDQFEAVMAEMAASTAYAGLVARAANRLAQKDAKERAGVISTAQRHTKFLDSPRVAATLSRSDFDMGDLKTGKLSLFVTLPAEQIGAYRSWLRIVVGLALASITRTKAPASAPRALLLLDEFATLGRMEPVETAMGLLGGYGAHLWLFLQDLAQLKGVYAKWETFLSNAAVLQSFGSSDKFTLDYLSAMLGQSTVLSTSRSGLIFGTPNRAESGRALMFGDEIRKMPPNEELLLVRGLAPIRCHKVNYLGDAEFRGAFDPNPMHV